MKFSILFIVNLLFFSTGYTSEAVHRVALKWNPNTTLINAMGEEQKVLDFSGCVPDPGRSFLPEYSVTIPLDRTQVISDVTVRNGMYELFQNDELTDIEGLDLIREELQVTYGIHYSAKKPYLFIQLIPIRYNSFFSGYEKLVSFDLLIEIEDAPRSASSVSNSWEYTFESVLSSGSWYRVGVPETGICRLTYNDLEGMGLPVSTLDPKNLRVYGNRGGMLPETTLIQSSDDLTELAVFVKGEEDGVFNGDDYLLFYGQSPDQWQYNPLAGGFFHTKHLYSGYSYYFITADLGPGKRIATVLQSPDPPNSEVNSYDDYFVHETDRENLIKSGRIWFGEFFDLYPKIDHELSFPGLLVSEPVVLRAEVAARSFVTSSFRFYINGDLKMTVPVSNVSNSPNTYYARSSSDEISMNLSSGTLNLSVEYVKPQSGSTGWLNYYQINYRRALSFRGGQMAFRDTRSAGQDSITRFMMGNATGSVTVWDVTDFANAGRVDATLNGSQLDFNVETGTIREYIAFDGTQFISPLFVEKVPNQNLHGLHKVDMIIIAHPLFVNQADRLAQHHRDFDGLTVEVVEPQLIYNEFSSGAQDVTAIRNFMKMLYDRAEEWNLPRYLLLFGDGSYDYKNLIENNTNFVPTWQSPESLHTVNSYVTDDYFGLLDDDPMDFMIDIGIGRFVVATEQEAKSAVDKVIHYAGASQVCMGSWRNTICLVADDEDSNLHLEDAEELASVIESLNGNVNLEKVYLDAYQQAATPGGERYPGANEDINRKVKRGALMLNYVGHGGEAGWAHERVLEIADINSWDNFDRMPVFITATCEFSRFDDPGRTSAGEFVFLNPKGGGIALFTTTRPTYAGSNSGLNKSYYKYALTPENGTYKRMGDIIRLAKTESGSNENGRKFILMGDPALKPAFPEFRVIATHINNYPILQGGDTITALSEITISGQVVDGSGQILTDYNGTLYPLVLDKPSQINSLGNDPGSIPRAFFIRKNALYNGKASINKGEWSFSFIAPKDIAYEFGFGKLSFYAENGELDAAGNSFDLVVGGYNTQAVPDLTGPAIRLFMNDENFVSGGITGPNPVLFALVEDESGINTVGSGIGHNLTATLNYTKTFTLNDYYEAEVDNFKRGSINYPFFGLEEGDYSLTVKIWDVHNNSSVASINFTVASADHLVMDKLFNYPNPFTESTVFSFEHNQAGGDLDITIRIYNLTGQQVRTLRDSGFAGGYRYKSLAWDGKDEGGNKLNHGMYIYRVEVTNRGGLLDEGTGKLVILR